MKATANNRFHATGYARSKLKELKGVGVIFL